MEYINTQADILFIFSRHVTVLNTHKTRYTMQTSTPIIDLHIHSTLKPYGNSFYENNDPTIFTNSSCIWFFDYRGRIDTGIENTLGISRYRQSDFSSLTNGQVKVALVSLYPIEKDFFKLTGWALRPFEAFIAQFASMLGKKRIENIRRDNFDYFKDLCEEYEFLCCLNKQERNSRTYTVLADADGLKTISNLLVIPTIEGCHAFCNGNDPTKASAWSTMEANVAEVRNWEHPPFFVTFAHHFYNGLCTHAKSLYDTAGKILDQSYGMRDGKGNYTDNLPPISDIGRELIATLLKRDTDGRRILIDVKHMSLEARQEYYTILDDYPDVPVIWSHGAVDMDNNAEINLRLDIDVAVIYKTNGIIGIEIDQRILGYNKNRLIKWLKGKIRPGRRAYNDAAYFFIQIIAIAEYAYKNPPANYPENDPWRCIALGSDYDGIINPLNAYPDATSLTVLYQYLIVHLNEYWENKSAVIPKAGLDAADVIYRIMYKNAYCFIKKHYRTNLTTGPADCTV